MDFCECQDDLLEDLLRLGLALVDPFRVNSTYTKTSNELKVYIKSSWASIF